jgi:hypothetical protein
LIIFIANYHHLKRDGILSQKMSFIHSTSEKKNIKVLLLSTYETGEEKKIQQKELDFEPEVIEDVLIQICTRQPTMMSERTRGGGSHYLLGMYFDETYGRGDKWTDSITPRDDYNPYERCAQDEEELNLDKYDLFLKGPEMSDTTDDFYMFVHYLDNVRECVTKSSKPEYQEFRENNKDLVDLIEAMDVEQIFMPLLDYDTL